MYYLNILKEQIKLSFMSVAIYRANFVLMLLQSIINSVLGILCVEFIYIHVDSIAGWSRDEMVILYCSSMIVNQIYRGLINPNHMRFIESISSGSFDRMLVKPVNVIFQINTGSIDYSSLTSLVAPIFVLCVKISSLDIGITGLNAVLFLVFLASAVILLTSFMMLLYSLAFKYIRVYGLTGIYFILMSISEKPKEIFSYKGIMYAFVFLIPSVPLANVPASLLLNKGNIPDMIAAAVSGMLFFLVSAAAIKRGIRKYSSASS
ncbi:MAG TPA: ABC-2 family transporter protein [Thermoclostridium sp.]